MGIASHELHGDNEGRTGKRPSSGKRAVRACCVGGFREPKKACQVHNRICGICEAMLGVCGGRKPSNCDAVIRVVAVVVFESSVFAVEFVTLYDGTNMAPRSGAKDCWLVSHLYSINFA